VHARTRGGQLTESEVGIDSPTPPAARRPGRGRSSLGYAVSDTIVLAKRSLLRIPHAPDLLLSFTVQAIIFVLLFGCVFGGAIDTLGIEDYTDF
jgi:hypothetical protein